MKGARALAGAVLILGLICALPAVSAAQDPGGGSTTSTTTADPPPTPPDPVGPADSGSSTPSAPADTASGKTHDSTGGGSGGSQDPSGGSTDTSASASPASSDTGSRLAHVAQTTTVQMKDFLFSPATVTVHVGDLITWRNTGKTPHTATADDGSFDTGTVTPGQSASHMFTKPGTFTYYCTIHPNMKGTVRVLGASGSSGSSGSASSSSSGSGSGPSEAQAVNSPDAAGDKNTLPQTGLEAGALALAGLSMLAMGLLVRSLTAAGHDDDRDHLRSPQIPMPEVSERDRFASRDVRLRGLVVLAVFSALALGISPMLRRRLERSS
jgi:plastocyanin